MTPPVPDPDMPIVDAHHHLYALNHWARDASPYLLGEFGRDLSAGHNVISTVYVECSQLYRATGPDHLRSTGEAEFAAVMGRLAESGAFGPARICEAFVGAADLALGDAVDEVLDALDFASDGRLRGIRGVANWDADPGINASKRPFAPQGLLADAQFRAGIARLAARGLAYDAWQFYPQLGELASLANAVPNATVICDHCGGLLGTRGYANPGNFDDWRNGVEALARQENVVMKLGGLANARNGFDFQSRSEPPDAEELVRLWSPYIEVCIEAFGPDRCMFESNFPVDMVAADYRTLWTVYKRIAAQYSYDERLAMFSGNARRIYRLQ